MMNIQRLRADTPGCATRNHLNNAGAGLMPLPVIESMVRHLELESEIGGYEAAETMSESISRAYESVAALIGTLPRNVALTEHATASFGQALSSVPFRRGDTILTTRHDYVSNQIMFLSLGKRLGVQVHCVRDADEGGVDMNALNEEIRRRRPRLVAITHVPTGSGLVQDVATIGQLCRRADVLFLVDACQSVGQLPVSVTEIGCDFLSGTGRKFLRGPRGSGFLYVSDRVLHEGLEPLLPDLRGADWITASTYRAVPDATRFETWEFAYGLVLGLGAAAEYALEVGVESIHARSSALAAMLRNDLAANPLVRVLDRGQNLCAIVTASVKNVESASAVQALRKRGINTWWITRGSAIFDFDAKGVNSALRISPHYYNTEAEIEAVVNGIGELAGA